MNSVLTEILAASAISATVTFSKPRSLNSRSAAAKIAVRVRRFFRSRSPSLAGAGLLHDARITGN